MSDVDRPQRVQSSIREFLHRQGTPIDPRQLLTRRWLRWFAPGLAFVHADRALHSLRNIASQVPLCVLHAVFLSWLNGWTTSRRFQVITPHGCRFSHQCGGLDEIEHYAICPELWGNFPGWARLQLNHLSLERFLLADRDDPNPTIKAAVAIFAVLGAFNWVKAKGIKYSHSELRAILSERIQMLRIRSSVICRAFPR